MSGSHYAMDEGSIHILGRSQTGKTVLARHMHAESPRLSIFINRPGEDRIPNIAGKEVRGIQALETGIQQGKRTFNYVSTDPGSDIRELIDWCWQLADLNDRGVDIQLTIDEIHEFAPQSQKTDLEPRDSIRKVAKRGMKRGIKLVGITQDPVSLDKQTLRQREYLAVFPLSAEQFRYMTDYGVTEAINDLPEYHARVYHASGEIVAKAVKGESRYS